MNLSRSVAGFRVPAHVARLPGVGKPPREHLVSSALLAVTAVALSSIAAVVALTATGGTEDTLGRAALHVVVIGAPVATGLYAVHHHHSERFGRMLIGAGLVWSLAVLGESSSSLLYSAGRIFAWSIFPLLVYLMLAFPSGRLTSRRDRLAFGSVLVLIAVLYIGSAPISETYPEHSPWASCDDDCPPNAFFVLSSEPAFVDSVLAPVRDGLSVLLLLGVTVALLVHLRTASPIQRVTTAPVLAVSALATLVLITFIVVRRAAPDAAGAGAVGLAWTLCLPAIAAAFSVGLLRRRLLISEVLSGLSLRLTASPTPSQVDDALRRAVGERAADVLVHARPGDGAVPETGLGDDDELVGAIVALTDAARREAHLRSKLETSLSDLDESRKRIATAADVERRRIERDLHDGAQQRLIALRMRLSLAEDLMREDPARAGRAFHDLGEDVDLALDEIRSLARGIYPALLADRGIAEALRSLARRSPLRVEVRANGVTRHPPEIESAVYFSCVEALQNVVKHAAGAKRVRIVLYQAGDLEFEVADDGEGFDPGAPHGGTGLRNMRDRVESVGGTLTTAASAGRGTVIRGAVPLLTPASESAPGTGGPP